MSLRFALNTLVTIAQIAAVGVTIIGALAEVEREHAIIDDSELHELIRLRRWQEASELVKTTRGKEMCKQRNGYALRVAIHDQAPEFLVMILIDENKQAIMQKSANGSSVLHTAAYCGASESVIERLIETYPDALDATNHDGLTPYSHYLRWKAEDNILLTAVAEKMLRKSSEEWREENDLHALIRKMSWEEASKLVRTMRGKELCRQSNKYGGLPLHVALLKQAPEFLLTLLIEENECAIKRPNKNGFFPLHLAVCHGGTSTSVIEKLIETYPDALDSKDDIYGLTPYFLYLEKNENEVRLTAIAKMLKKSSKEWFEDNELHALIRKEKWEEASKLVKTMEGKAMSRQSNRFDGLPLHIALSKQAPEFLIMLLIEENKYATKKPTKNKCLPLHLAAYYGAPETVIEKLICTYPYALKSKTIDGLTPYNLYLKSNERKNKSEHFLTPSAEKMLKISFRDW
eukprot:CAMPEP_0194184582 /NCGR_PEP_ID=MMETSP0154-20130528/38716_1 /TAXON_ID=1049557 /ORGANISM="Thalassiothrix antarctica, Strain L6-D1" /LENGTH=459 /DNA_ID=CAMNT_0038902349 /DNA_START=68 /DNA_END=1444 /DNA_ORIENTATION=-